MLTLATEIWGSNVSETLRPRLSLPMIFYLMEANSLAITNMLVAALVNNADSLENPRPVARRRGS